MEAVPRLHMLWFALKSSPEGTSFAALKKYIAEFYHEDPEAYSKEVHALETLRNQAMHTTKDGAPVMKRYYCQLHALQNRFPQLADRGIFTFKWKDLYHSAVHEVTDLRFERAAVLFNIAALHTQSGASVTRGDVDGMKMACTHFQAAAWAYGELRERYANVNSGGDFMTPELLVFQQQVCFAQAQECILEKSLIDNRKPHIVAKVTAQIVVYYGAALAALLTGGDDGPVAQVIDSSVYKLWKKYVRFKINYLTCILYLYQGQHSEEKRQMGERVTLYQASWDKLEEARKESKGLPDQREINESLSFTADVVEAKRKNAKNENEFIYHEAVPELSTIAAVQGANLVNGIGFQVSDEEHAGPDIFARLVPMKAHEASSLYSEEKAKLLRKYGALLEEKDTQLESYMSSLTLDNLNINEEQANKLPQGIVDRCAALNANKTAISDLVEAMSQLAEITADVETNLGEISSMLEAEAKAEREFQSATGVQRTPNAHITELSREFQKYSEAHARAGESNNTLRKAMSLHVNNLKILARPLPEIQQLMPKLSSELNTTEIFRDVKLILNKVNEMKAQRAQFHADLRIAINEDDITGKVIAHGGQEGLQALFATELGKHDKITALLDQNMVAQGNILQALTENYAKAAPVLKTLQDVKQKREHFYSSLAASYDVYEDLLAKSAKGLEFYKKLAGNVQKLLTRFRSARDVQSEERQQRMQSVKATTTPVVSKPIAETTPVPAVSSTPKLRDYLKAKAAMADASNPAYVPTVRPVPVGSENPTQAACSYATAPPNEPPPPYSLTQQQYFDPSARRLHESHVSAATAAHCSTGLQGPSIANSQTLHGALGLMNLHARRRQHQAAWHTITGIQTGIYEYSSGYQQDTSSLKGSQASQSYQFSQSGKQQSVGTTDSEIASRSNTATGFDSPIVSHTKVNMAAKDSTSAMEGNESSNYYSTPYGYLGSVNPQQQPTPAPPSNSTASIYMQSGASSTAETQTTSSGAPYASSAALTKVEPKPEALAPKVTSNVDLLSDLDIDCSVAVPPPMLPQPVLQPQVVATPTPPASQVSVPVKVESVAEHAAPATPEIPVAATEGTAQASVTIPSGPKCASLDNLSNCSDLSSLENFDWDSVSVTHSVSEKPTKASGTANGHSSTFAFQSETFTDEKTTKYFQKEVESYEKLLENLHVKMLNGKTQLGAKWQELQQKLDKEAAANKRSTTIAKLFPEKNRSLDCLPYDHARVKLDKQTDDYINAAYMKNLSAGCPNFIVAQTPQPNTINDFWSMIWSEKSRTVVCLHTPNELFDPYWPQALDQPTHYDDYTVTCLKLQQLSHCSEYQLKLSMHGADAVLDLSLLQLKQWTKGAPAQLLGVAENALETHRQRCQAANAPQSPLIMNCLTGSERSELVAIGVCAIIATQNKQPILINTIDVWSRICAQRQNSLRDSAILEQSMQIVLCNAHNVLNKRGIMTSYQMKMAPQVTAKEQQENKDPLNELDALWKLK
ncbi:GD12600 [Drosophila simulans]|uniref:GD12600 n=1 Tax=Drosophila simulans TaxID=7240 RepID=B4QK30_DROSI|nr:GD12600 [Drosophila simulans]